MTKHGMVHTSLSHSELLMVNYWVCVCVAFLACLVLQIRSPQFQQSLASLSHALTTDNYETIFANFGLNPMDGRAELERGDMIGSFLAALRKQARREAGEVLDDDEDDGDDEDDEDDEMHDGEDDDEDEGMDGEDDDGGYGDIE